MTARIPLLRRVLVAHGDAAAREVLRAALAEQGHEPVLAGSAEAAERELTGRPVELVIAEAALAARLLPQAVAPLIVTSDAASLDAALAVLDAGAHAHLGLPLRAAELHAALRSLEEREKNRGELSRLRQSQGDRETARRERATRALGAHKVIGRSPRMLGLLRDVQRYAEHKTTVLIQGESGTGKELIARALHEWGPRAGKPFVPVLCGAIPEALMESELFGHRKGSFTDASRDKKGLFEAADGGTIFLDEVGEVPLGVQAKLLRVLQEEQVRRIGDVADTRIDVRVVAATMRELDAEVAAGRFREDLYFRLNVLPVGLPPLREREGDLGLLVEALIDKHAARLGVPAAGVTADALALMEAYPWPGNVRELENTIERALVLCEAESIDTDLLPERLRGQDPAPARPVVASGDDLSIKKMSRAMEKTLIRKALELTGGNRTSAAKILEISHRALLYKIKEYGLG